MKSFPSFFGGNPFGSKGWQGKKPKKFEVIEQKKNWSKKKSDFCFGGMQRVMG